MTLTTKIRLGVDAVHQNPLDLISPSGSLAFKIEKDLADGNADDQANNMFSDQRTLAASASEDLDLSGTALQNIFGADLAFTKIKALLIRASDANTNDVLVGGAAANQFLTPFGAATDVVKIPPGGWFAVGAPKGGFAVTAGTGDLLKIANGGAGTSVTYDIVLIGVT